MIVEISGKNMQDDKAVSKKPHVDFCRACLLRTFSEPDLSIRLMELEKNSTKKSNFNRTRSLFIYPHENYESSDDTDKSAQSLSSTSSEGDDDVFLDNEEACSAYETNTTPRPYSTPRSSCQSISRFFISSSSLTLASSFSSNQNIDSPEAYLSSAKRRYTL